MPFAKMSDYGVLCFEAIDGKTDHNYLIVSFDHEDDYATPEYYAKNFESMFVEFENHLEEWINNRRENYTS